MSENSVTPGRAQAEHEFVTVARAAELPPGALKRVEVAGRRIALANVGGTVHAIEGQCLHAGGPLAAGALAGSVVTCPWHGWRWDAATGRNVWPGVDWRLRRFPVRIVDGEIQVRVAP